jgi:hypothetical protein
VGVVRHAEAGRQGDRASKDRSVIPVEVTQAPWHATGFWDWVDHWQTLIAGDLAFLAGVGTVVVAMIIARRQIDASIRRT